MIEADLPSLDPSRFRRILDSERWSRFDCTLRNGAAMLESRSIVHVNSTMTGGGVAELLSSVLGYLIGAGVRSRWLVLEGNDDFFVLTKRIHHLLHGKTGDGGDLGPSERDLYRSVLARELGTLAEQIAPGDVVVLHDPQVVGLAPHLREFGASVIWNCHVGADEPNEFTQRAWDFLLPAAQDAQAQVFSRSCYAWAGLDAGGVVVIPPCIDAFSPKNQEMAPDQVRGILAATGLIGRPSDVASGGSASFTRVDGTKGIVRGATRIVENRPLPSDVPIVTQVSRWDPLKDHAGVAHSFAEWVPEELGAHLVLAGPAPEAVADDPEGSATLDELRACLASLPEPARSRVHLACLPMEDLEENAAIVNALQRRSDVIVQKSLAEGFGLTVAEAMWKARPTVASAVGGIQDQICHGVTGVLVDDPEDGSAFGAAISKLLADGATAALLGKAAHSSVVDNYLAPGYLGSYLELIERVMTA